MTYYPSPGNIAHLTSEFEIGGENTDPTTVSVYVRDPSGALTTYTPTRDDAGQYHYDLLLTASGEWSYRFQGTGAATAQTEDIKINVGTVFSGSA